MISSLWVRNDRTMSASCSGQEPGSRHCGNGWCGCRGTGHEPLLRRLPRPVRSPAVAAPTCAATSWPFTPETADAATIEIRPGADWAGHVPGQYVRIGVDVDGVRRVARLLADPRTPGRRPDQRHHRRRDRTARSATTSSATGRPGTLVRLEQATGDFVLPTEGGQLPLRHRRLRHHPGDRHAAQPVPGVRRGRRPARPLGALWRSSSCTSRPPRPTRSSWPTCGSSTPPG